MSISWYECEIITQILVHHFGCRGLSVATIYGQGNIAESQGKVREKSGKSQGISFSISCGNPVINSVYLITFDLISPLVNFSY